MGKTIEIGTLRVGPTQPPAIVAELSANHLGKKERAIALINAAAAAGAHAIKLQTYTPDTITMQVDNPPFLLTKGPWAGRTLWDLYQEAHTPWEWHHDLAACANNLGLPLFSSPFDPTAVDFLSSQNAPCYKIASPEIVDLPLIQKTATTQKPLILSTGGATLTEIKDAVDTARTAGCKDLLLLQCTSAYPTVPKDAHLRRLPVLAETFHTPVGLSDHTRTLGVPLASIALGSCLIEVHFTLNRKDGGPDAPFSLEPNELKLLVTESKKAWEALGNPNAVVPTGRDLRPSLRFSLDLPAGTVLTANQVRSVRPAGGLPPKDHPLVVGKTLTQDVKTGDPVTWEDLE